MKKGTRLRSPVEDATSCLRYRPRLTLAGLGRGNPGRVANFVCDPNSGESPGAKEKGNFKALHHERRGNHPRPPQDEPHRRRRRRRGDAAPIDMAVRRAEMLIEENVTLPLMRDKELWLMQDMEKEAWKGIVDAMCPRQDYFYE